MQHESRWLDQLTEFVLTTSELSDSGQSAKDWLDQTAQILAGRFGPNCGVAVIRAAAGSPKAPWSNSTYAIYCTSPELNKTWRFRYTAAVVSIGLTPADCINSDFDGGQFCWRLSEPCPQPKLQEMGNLLVRQHGVRTFMHCVHAIPREDGIVAGALILDAWDWDQKSDDALPPKTVFQNFTRAIAVNLVRVERGQSQNKDSLINRLTPAQRKVAALLLQGLSEKQTAEHLERSPHTIHQHVKAIYATISVRSRAEFMARCQPVAVSNPKTPHKDSSDETTSP